MVKVYVLRQAPAGSIALAPVAETPKIVAAVQPLPRQRSTSDSNEDLPAAAKRTRLTGLNHEDRLERRKLKNRIAAQTARDRKKARMEELEDLVKQMEKEKELLVQENLRLKSQSTELVQQNKSLRSMIMGNLSESEPAVLLTSPQQKGRARFLFLTLLLSLIQAPSCSSKAKSFQRQSALKLLRLMQRSSVADRQQMYRQIPSRSFYPILKDTMEMMERPP